MGNKSGKSTKENMTTLNSIGTANAKHLRNMFIDYSNNQTIQNKERYIFIESSTQKYPNIDSNNLEYEFNFFEMGTKQYSITKLIKNQNIVKHNTEKTHYMYTEIVLEMDLMRECYKDFIIRLLKDFKMEYDVVIELLYIYTYNINHDINKNKNGFKLLWDYIKSELDNDICMWEQEMQQINKAINK